MTKGVPHLFAAMKSMAEDMHAIAVEGQRRDNGREMQRVLVSQLRMTITAMDNKMGEMKHRLGDAHD